MKQPFPATSIAAHAAAVGARSTAAPAPVASQSKPTNSRCTDVIDSAIAAARRDEPERPLSELLTRHGLA